MVLSCAGLSLTAGGVPPPPPPPQGIVFIPTPVATSITRHFNLSTDTDTNLTSSAGGNGGGGWSSSKAVAGAKASYDMATPAASPGLVTGDMLAALTANMYDGDLVVLPEVGAREGRCADWGWAWKRHRRTWHRCTRRACKAFRGEGGTKY